MFGGSMKTAALLAAAVALAVTFAGCGGDDDADEASGPRGGGVEAVHRGGDDGDAGEPSSGGVVTSGGTNPSSLPALLDRKIIRTATLSIETGTVSQDFENVGTIAAGYGGFVASSSFGNDGEEQTASITIRIPGDRYEDALRDLRKLGDVREENSGTNEVTEEYTDLQSRLRNLRSTEQRYLELMARANTIDEILTMEDRIAGTRAEIEQVQGRIQLLDAQTELATITVHLAPVIAGSGDGGGIGSPLEVAEEAFDASLMVLLGMAVALVAVGAFFWWLAPAGAVAWWIWRKFGQRRRAEVGG